MSQHGQGARPDHTYSMDWSKQFSNNQKRRSSCKCNCYNCSKVRWRQVPVPGIDKSTQTESLSYEYYLEDWRGPGHIDNEIETEEHKVCVMPDVVSQMDVKENDEYLDYTQGIHFKCEDKVVPQDSFMPEEKYVCKDLIRPCYIKDEVAPETNCVLQGCGTEYNFPNNPLPQQPSCSCAERKVCPYEVYGEAMNCSSWCEERMQVDAEVQADEFECDSPIKCIKCGVVLQGRSCCIKQCILAVYECNNCVMRGVRGPTATCYAYYPPINGQDTLASGKNVACQYCKKTFTTTKGMRIHSTRIHKGVAIKN